MGRLNKLRCYVAGAMQYTNDEHSWRDMVTDKLKPYGVEVINPAARTRFAKESQVIRDEMIELVKVGDYQTVRERGRNIRNVDLNCVDKSDFLVVYLDLNIRTVGTYEELFWANRSKTPILLVIPQGKQSTPLWLLWTLPHQHIFSSFDELFQYLEYVDSSTDIENPGNRWIFYNEYATAEQ